MICGGAEAAITPLGMAGFCAMRAVSQLRGEAWESCEVEGRGRRGRRLLTNVVLVPSGTGESLSEFGRSHENRECL